MKRIRLFFMVTVCISLCVLGCRKEEPVTSQNVPESSVSEASVSPVEPFPEGNLDYSRKLPEPETSGDTSIQNPAVSENAGESVIPGLRPLDQYKTKYLTQRQELPNPMPAHQEAAGADTSAAKQEPVDRNRCLTKQILRQTTTQPERSQPFRQAKRPRPDR